ncbi:MAG: hypothetical protein NC218_08975 [Acetobacter sp.]|nr:hypothetical protein [Acetobacter sp.]
MCKNNWLFLMILYVCGVFIWAAPVFAQSEMDLLLSEKKNEKTDGDIDLGIDIDKTLSDNLAKTSEKNKKQKEETAEDEPEETENWLKSLIMGSKKKGNTENASTSFDEDDEDEIRKLILSQRKNAAHFDISGVKLRMSPEEIDKTLTSQGYRRILQTMEIPNFIKWRSEELCRQNGVIGFERLNACATKVAVENGYNFIERATYNRYATKESIDVYFTSNFTGNLAHRIFYKSSIPLSDSKASNNVYINNLKIYDFWRRIDLKYGPPDNTSEIKWGLGGKKPYMKAKTGYLELADPLLKNLDTARMFNEDTRLSNTNYYTF